MEWDRHYFPFALTNPRASVSDVLCMAPWLQTAVVSVAWTKVHATFVNFVSAGGRLCGLVGYAGFAMTEVPRYLT